MKETLLVAMASAAIGACVGGGVVMLGSSPAASVQAPQSPDALVTALERSVGRPLADIRREIAALRAGAEPAQREASAEEPAAPVASAAGDSPAAVRDANRRARRREEPRHEQASISAGSTMIRDASTPVREKNVSRVNELLVRTKEALAKRRTDWMFMSETALADELGVPDEVETDEKGGKETWNYNIMFVNTEGETEGTHAAFVISRGRVIEIECAEEIPDDQ